ncbi:MAG: porphobilinogen synthase [Clostridia bacterium]|nr:porphobilinogen synthase [Clostridia bacterium]MCI9086835.1 porphobilinogen synthase [Clostridia bacterium]
MIRRPRRLRLTPQIRDLVSEISLNVTDLIYPIFVIDGETEDIPSMPNIKRYSLNDLPDALKEIVSVGVKSVLFFGIPKEKDETGSGAYDDNGIVQRAVRLTKEIYPDLIVITDICLCEYTSHGHCGILENNVVSNDQTLPLLAKAAISCARAGADIIAPSDMMDGRVGVIRNSLDKEGFQNIPIMSYSVKYSSSFYGPFRDAANSAPSFGDRKSYQMDYRNKKEALIETQLDIDEGADIIMVKPALPYLDIAKTISDTFSVPLAIYHVSGEYSMIKAAAQNGWIDEKSVVLESLTAMKRAGAKMIITYYAVEAAHWLKGE